MYKDNIDNDIHHLVWNISLKFFDVEEEPYLWYNLYHRSHKDNSYSLNQLYN